MYLPWHTCDHCGKRAYSSRKRARSAAKQLASGCNAYRCIHGGNGWHIGHLPDAVRHGDIDRSGLAPKRTR